MRQSEKYWMKVLVLALCLCLSYATYTFHIVSRSDFRVLPHLYWWTTAFQLFFFAALPKFCLSCFKNIFQSIAANLIQGKLFSHFSRIFFLPQMCYHTLPTESFWQTFVEDRHMISIKTTLSQMDGCSFLATSFPGFFPTLPPGDELDRALRMRLLSRDCFAIVVLCQKSRKIELYTSHVQGLVDLFT